MLRVALTGGLASGKSYIGQLLQQHGCLLVKADLLGHEVLLPGGEAAAAVTAEFGSAILDVEGIIDRKKLAAEVFGKPERLAVLNGLVHPPVRARTEALLSEFAAREPHGIAVVEAAIHIETGGYRNFDRVVLAWCRPEQQVERAMNRDHATFEEVQARLSRQMPLDEKRNYAHYVIDTSGTKEDTARQTVDLYKELRRIAQ
jgi:dephospho-CoA kinase